MPYHLPLCEREATIIIVSVASIKQLWLVKRGHSLTEYEYIVLFFVSHFVCNNTIYIWWKLQYANILSICVIHHAWFPNNNAFNANDKKLTENIAHLACMRIGILLYWHTKKNLQRSNSVSTLCSRCGCGKPIKDVYCTHYTYKTTVFTVRIMWQWRLVPVALRDWWWFRMQTNETQCTFIYFICMLSVACTMYGHQT